MTIKTFINTILFAIFFYSVCMSQPLNEESYMSTYDEKFRPLIHIKSLNELHQVRTQFTVNDAPQLVSIAKDRSVPFQARKNALQLLNLMVEPALFDQFISIHERILDLSNYVTIKNIDSFFKKNKLKPYINEILLFHLCNTSIGNLGTDEAVAFLKEKWKRGHWYEDTVNNDVKILLDDHYRLPVFKGLAQAAIKRPELFDYIDELIQTESGPLVVNMKSLIKDYKENYFKLHPEFLPREGYSLEIENDPKQAILSMAWKIQGYFEKFNRLPDSLLDLTISNGGTSAYLYGDVHSNTQDRMLKYSRVSGTIDGAQYWTFILLSVGPNRKADMDMNKLSLGLSNKEAENRLIDPKDDIFEVFTYQSSEF